MDFENWKGFESGTWKKEINRWNKIKVRAEYTQNIYFVHCNVKFEYRKGGYHGFI